MALDLTSSSLRSKPLQGPQKGSDLPTVTQHVHDKVTPGLLSLLPRPHPICLNIPVDTGQELPTPRSPAERSPYCVQSALLVPLPKPTVIRHLSLWAVPLTLAPGGRHPQYRPFLSFHPELELECVLQGRCQEFTPCKPPPEELTTSQRSLWWRQPLRRQKGVPFSCASVRVPSLSPF